MPVCSCGRTIKAAGPYARRFSFASHEGYWFSFAFCSYPSVLLADQFDEAVSAFERGDFASAESTLRSLLKTTPSNASALGLLGAVLDGEKRYPEAEDMYRRAIKLSPRSATLLNNYANHQLMTGDKAGARATYLRVVAVDPGRANANLQLAQFAVDNKDGTAALRYLGHLTAELRPRNRRYRYFSCRLFIWRSVQRRRAR